MNHKTTKRKRKERKKKEEKKKEEAFDASPAYPAISRSVLKDRQRVRPARKDGLLIRLGALPVPGPPAPEPEAAAEPLTALLLVVLVLAVVTAVTRSPLPPTPMAGLDKERLRVSEMACML